MRIVSLAPSVTETLFALGAGGELVGVSTYCDYPPEAQKIDKVGTYLSPSAEVILAKRPDLVIAVPSPGNRAPVQALERAGLDVLVVDPEKSVASMRQAISAIAVAIDRAEAGGELIRRIDADLAGVRTRIGAAPPRRTLMVVGHSPLVGVGGGSFLDDLIVMAGGTNVAAAGGNWPHLSLEFVLAQAPEVIIDTAMGTEASTTDAADFWKQLETLPAVQQDRVYALRELTLLRPGPRVGEALLLLARLIQPQAFNATPS
jgi:iron complex transport system substrate-binding protein